VPAYDPLAMRSRRPTVLAMPLVLAASQVGHLVATELRQGPHSLTPGHSGAHAYIPMLLAMVLGTAGAIVMAALMLVAAARARRAGRQVATPAHRGCLLDYAAVLFAAQLAIFLVQETVESLVAGGPTPTVAGLVLWGTIGQLPVAALAAPLMRALLSRVESAADELAAAPRPLATRPALAPVPHAFTPASSRPRRRLRARARGQRAPPRTLRPQLST
jgi:hypothetical protein